MTFWASSPMRQAILASELTLRSRATYNRIPMRRFFIPGVLAASLVVAFFCDDFRARLPILAAAHAAQSPATQEPASQSAPSQEPPPTRQDQARIVTNVNLVDVLFTVLNRRNKLVP